MESIDQSLFIAATSLLAAMYEVGAMSWNSGPVVLIVVLIVDETVSAMLYIQCKSVVFTNSPFSRNKHHSICLVFQFENKPKCDNIMARSTSLLTAIMCKLVATLLINIY